MPTVEIKTPKTVHFTEDFAQDAYPSWQKKHQWLGLTENCSHSYK
jgi:hypothetical protein